MTEVYEDVEVCQREDLVYCRNLDSAYEYYKHLQAMLEELGFDEIESPRAEHWMDLPFKATLKAYKWKDPYTRIYIKIKGRIKSPKADRRDTQETVKGQFFVEGYVQRVRYPHWEWFEEKSWFKKSWLHKVVRKMFKSVFFRKEWEKYKEEAEELTIEIVSRIREAVGSLPAIGKSKREWHNPSFRNDGDGA